MGAALAVLAAASAPERVEALILIGPAGLPLVKPVRRSAHDLVQQTVRGKHQIRDVAWSALDLASAPRASIRLASREMSNASGCTANSASNSASGVACTRPGKSLISTAVTFVSHVFPGGMAC